MENKVTEQMVLGYGEMVRNLAKPGAELLATATPEKMHLLHMVVGLAGEVGELLETYFELEEAGDSTIVEECGDLLFYRTGYRQGLGRPAGFEEIEAAREVSSESHVRLVVAAAGLLDITKRHVCYNKPIDEEKMTKLLSDFDKYFGRVIKASNLTLADVVEANEKKLLKGDRARYAEGVYSDAAALARRDKQGEDNG